MDDRGMAVAPIISVARYYTGAPRLKQHLAAIAVMFEFVNPLLAVGRLIHRRSELGHDEAKRRRNAGHTRYLGGGEGNWSLTKRASALGLPLWRRGRY